MNLRLILILSLLTFGSFARESIRVMTFNAENLFDTEDDPNTDDETYLPLSVKKNTDHVKKCKKIKNKKYRNECFNLNWDSKALGKKIANLKLKIFENESPDILILTEIENKKILEQLNDSFGHFKFDFVELKEGDDPRGIDVGILSRFPWAHSPQLYSTKIKDPKTDRSMKTRGILNVVVEIALHRKLSIYGIHLPSQGSPTATRRDILKELEMIIRKDKNPWIVAGDWNVTEKEEGQHNIIRDSIGSVAEISHWVGCETCLGTHFYKNKWSFLDMIAFDRRLPEFGLSLDRASIRVHNRLFKKGRTSAPERFDSELGRGVSDHLPISARIKVSQKKIDK